MINPINKTILVKPEFRKEKTESGLYLKYSQKLESPPQIGTITHADNPVNVKVGGRVLFRLPKTGNPKGFKLDKESYIYVTEDQIVAIIDPDVEVHIV